MMFILIQSKGENIKYVTSKDYDKLIQYIYETFSKVTKYNRNYFVSRDGIQFKIVLGSDLDEQTI